MARPFTLEPDYSASTQFIYSNGSDSIVLDNAAAVFEGKYARDGRDLKIEAPDGSTYTIIDYFAQEQPPTLITTSGAMLSGSTVEALAGSVYPAQYAQAGKSVVAAGQLVNIGKVQTLDGT